MFYSGLDYAKETGETTAGTTLIPTQFVWPFGGGSWSGNYSMTPVEGCPTVFQTICSLPPSYHQELWAVNTIFLARESDYVPGILNPQMHSGSNMDVDNESFRHLVRVSGGPLHEALPRVSEADLEVSRHHITIFLSTHMVIALDVDLPVKLAFHILHEQGIPMAPLGDFCMG
ncbi:hypothetical protein CsSME_00013718 [Camellia sinensis var. sinensis]